MSYAISSGLPDSMNKASVLASVQHVSPVFYYSWAFEFVSHLQCQCALGGMQGGIQGHHYHLCLCVLPVDPTQPVDDALDGPQNRRGQLFAPFIFTWGGGGGGGC